MATFGYGRVSTQDQTTDNQRLEIERAGYTIDYWFADEGVSGAVLAAQRPQFRDMLTKIRAGESLVVTKIDRLGRDAVDIQQTVKQFKALGVRVFVTQLGATDLTNSAGKMLLGMLAAFAEMERDLIVERTQAGLARARAQGVRLGRPSKTSENDRTTIRGRLAAGETVSAVARSYGVSRACVIGIRNAVDRRATDRGWSCAAKKAGSARADFSHPYDPTLTTSRSFPCRCALPCPRPYRRRDRDHSWARIHRCLLRRSMGLHLYPSPLRWSWNGSYPWIAWNPWSSRRRSCWNPRLPPSAHLRRCRLCPQPRRCRPLRWTVSPPTPDHPEWTARIHL